MFDEAIEEDGNRSKLRVFVTAGSGKFEITAIDPWRKSLRVKINEQPENGKANRALEKALSEAFGAEVEILSGKKSREKTLQINAAKPFVKKRLEMLLNA